MSDNTNKLLAVARVGLGLVSAYCVGRTVQAMLKQQETAPQVKGLSKSYNRQNPVLNYIVEKTVQLHPAQEKLIQETMKQKLALMLGAPEQLQFLAHLVKNMGGKKTLDIGVFTGYSALSIALALPEDGRVVACDISEEFTNVGKPYWKEAGVDKKIDLKIAPATETLQHLIDMGGAGTYDFAFIDADKPNYGNYYELALTLLRSGGVIALDNLVWFGKVADESVQDSNTKALREVTAKIAADPRVNFTLLNVGDGTGLAFKL